jgi:hypothetical protein
LLEVCPLRLQLAAALDVRPCLTGAAGVLLAEAQGTGITSQGPRTSMWLEVGGAALLEWTVVGPLALQGEAGFSVLPPSGETFYFDPPPASTTVYRVPPIVGLGRLGLAIRFL